GERPLEARVPDQLLAQPPLRRQLSGLGIRDARRRVVLLLSLGRLVIGAGARLALFALRQRERRVAARLACSAGAGARRSHQQLVGIGLRRRELTECAVVRFCLTSCEQLAPEATRAQPALR